MLLASVNKAHLKQKLGKEGFNNIFVRGQVDNSTEGWLNKASFLKIQISASDLLLHTL